jgi:hypothetical protein
VEAGKAHCTHAPQEIPSARPLSHVWTESAEHPMTQKVYFDESGFTGNNLLHPDQMFFAYASVATDDDEARAFVESLSAKYGIQGGELKGSNLTRFNRGRKAIDDIFMHFETRLKVSISNKKFALACKFHEYIFEPCFSSISSIFYHVGFVQHQR